MNDLKVASLVSLEYKGSNVGILVGCYYAAIDVQTVYYRPNKEPICANLILDYFIKPKILHLQDA